MFTEMPLVLTLGQTDAAPDQPSGPIATPGNGDGAGAAPGNGTDTSTTTDGGNGQEPIPPKTNDPLGGLMSFLPFILIIAVFWYFLWGSQRKEKKKRQEMMDTISKNDKVVTIGGIIGTVVDVRDSEVVLKVDESSNTRMRFSKNAIQSVVAEKEA